MSDNDTVLAFRLRRPSFELTIEQQLPAHGITALFGPSGAGKTSVLRCVAGLDRPTAATIRIAGEIWQDDSRGVFLPTWRRALGYVFQEASLFEHLDVRGNVEFGLRFANKNKQAHLARMIELLGIGALLTRQHDELSGGERQRVAIARALATEPGLLLLDEPLAAIDQARRAEILPWLVRLRDELKIPMLYVSHSVDEVARLADRIVVLESGTVRASGGVNDVLASLQAPVMLGDDLGAVLEARIAERDPQWQLARAAFAGGELWLADRGQPLGDTVRIRVLARDVSIALAANAGLSVQNQLKGRVLGLAPDAHAAQMLVQVDCAGTRLLARVTRKAVAALDLTTGREVWALVKSAAIVS